jgi:Domain of Unknown Function (DUF1206)
MNEPKLVGRRVTKSAPFQFVARLGMVAYGAVHLLVAWLMVQVAYGDLDSGDKADKTGALQSVSATPVGGVLLWLIAVGLAVTTLWQLLEALTSERRAWLRVMNLGEAVLFGYLSFSAGKLAAGSPSSSTDQAQLGLIGSLLREPWGEAAVMAIGVGVVVAGLFIARHGLVHDFAEGLDLTRASAPTRRLVLRLGQIGYVALGSMYGIAGALVVVAAARNDPSKATGLDVALKTLAAQSYGTVVLTVIALGLTAFAAFTPFAARYHRR